MEESKLAILVDNIMRVKPMFYKSLGKPVPMNSDITPGAYYALLYLKKHCTLSMSDIGNMLLISKPNVTVLINKLIENELVARLADEQDRRIILIQLTEKGNQFIEKNQQQYLEQIRQKLTLLSDIELESFSTSIQVIKDTLVKIAGFGSSENIN